MRRTIYLALLLLVTCGPPPQDGGEPSAATVQEATTARTTLQPAADVAAQALTQARELLGVNAKADPPKALALLEATFGSAPADAEAAFLLARAAFRADASARCRLALDTYFALDPKEHVEWRAEAWVLRGWLCEHEGRFRDALPNYEKALAVLPAYPWALFRMGNALAEAGDDATALLWVDQAIARRPGLIEAHFLRAQLLRRAGRAEEAERVAEIHRLLNQTGDNSANTRESVMEKLAALERLEVVLPQWIEGRVQLARMQATLGQRERALERLKALVIESAATSQATGEAWSLLIELLRGTLGDDAARRELGRVVARCKTLPAELKLQLDQAVKDGFGK